MRVLLRKNGNPLSVYLISSLEYILENQRLIVLTSSGEILISATEVDVAEAQAYIMQLYKAGTVILTEEFNSIQE